MINIVNEFQSNIYNLLAGNQNIQKEISRIYLSVAQNAKYPFLLIDILQIEDLSKFDHFIYNVKFEICAYARDKTIAVLTNIAEQIMNILKPEQNYLANYQISGIKSGIVNFERSQDLLTTKMTIEYQALLAQV